MKRKITTPTLLMFIAAIAMMIVSTVGITRAAMTETETYDSQIDMKNIGVILQENGLEVEGDNLLFEFVRGDYGKFKIGVTYPEVITVQNSGDIDEYVRVIVKKYWVDDGTGKKNNELDPKYIELVINDKDWIKDENASTAEREVYYYKKILKPATDTAEAEVSTPLITNLKINTEVKQIVDITTGEDGKPYGTYAYNGKWFGLDVEVDAVQTHHAKDAIKSAWGVDATVDEAAGTLTEVKS